MSPAHQLLDEIRLLCTGSADVLADVIDADDVLVREAAHRLRLAHDPLAAYLVKALGLDQREGDIAVEQGVVGQEDASCRPRRGTGAFCSGHRRTIRVAEADVSGCSIISGPVSGWDGVEPSDASARAARAIVRKPAASSLSASMLNTALAFSATDFQSPELMDVSASSRSASIRRCIRSLGIADVVIVEARTRGRECGGRSSIASDAVLRLRRTVPAFASSPAAEAGRESAIRPGQCLRLMEGAVHRSSETREPRIATVSQIPVDSDLRGSEPQWRDKWRD